MWTKKSNSDSKRLLDTLFKRKLLTTAIAAVILSASVEISTAEAESQRPNLWTENPFKLSESHGKFLAWPIPLDYFEKWDGSDYYNEVEENFWKDAAEKFKEYSEYFASIVEEWSELDIIDFLSGLFNSPWDKELLADFETEVNEYIKPWVKIDSKKFSDMHWKLTQLWEWLKWENQELTLALVNQDEIIKWLDEKLKKLIYDRVNLEWEWKELDRLEKELDKESASLDKESALLHMKLLKVRNNIKKNRETIKMLDRAIYFMKEDIAGLNNI